MNNLDDLAKRYQNDPAFHALVSLIEHGLATGQYSIQEFREATTLAAWKIADETVRPIMFAPRRPLTGQGERG